MKIRRGLSPSSSCAQDGPLRGPLPAARNGILAFWRDTPPSSFGVLALSREIVSVDSASPQLRIQNHESRIKNQESRIKNHESRIPQRELDRFADQLLEGLEMTIRCPHLQFGVALRAQLNQHVVIALLQFKP